MKECKYFSNLQNFTLWKLSRPLVCRHPLNQRRLETSWSWLCKTFDFDTWKRNVSLLRKRMSLSSCNLSSYYCYTAKQRFCLWIFPVDPYIVIYCSKRYVQPPLLDATLVGLAPRRESRSRCAHTCKGAGYVSYFDLQRLQTSFRFIAQLCSIFVWCGNFSWYVVDKFS